MLVTRLASVVLLLHLAALSVDCRLESDFVGFVERYASLMNATKPEQFHISLGKTASTVFVTWVTHTDASCMSVRYGLKENNLSQEVIASKSLFVDGGRLKRNRTIFRARLDKVLPNSLYYYQIGLCSRPRLVLASYLEALFGHRVHSVLKQHSMSSEVMHFRSYSADPSQSVRMALIGDMGVLNGVSLPELIKEARDQTIDMVLHVGDFAYDMYVADGEVGDLFMRGIEPVASFIPYMPAVGNHENAYNFSHYTNRFTTEGGSGDSFYYSFDIGRMHVIAFSSEFYYYVEYGWEQIVNQWYWLKQDLAKANKNRDKRPWILAMGHRPMYCSNSNDPEHCTNKDNTIREGIIHQDAHMFSLEELFYEAGVDFVIGAHEHSYERFWPVYKSKVCNGTEKPDNVYYNPPAPVHIITGSGGCQEFVDPFLPHPNNYSAFRSDDYGYTHLEVFNHTHVKISQISVKYKPEAKKIDEITVVKTKHGKGLFKCHQ